MIYRQQSITRKIPTCAITHDEFLTLFELCKELHNRCKQKFKNDLISGSYHAGIVQEEDLIDDLINNDFLWSLEIFGTEGEYFNSSNPQTIEKNDFPLLISKIKFGNLFPYEYKRKQKPSIYFELSIDFKEVMIIDLLTSPTKSTDNDSFFIVAGIDSITVMGITNLLDNFFKKHSTYNNIINAENVYDLLLWLFFFPVLLIYLFKFKDAFPEIIVSAPNILQTILGIVLWFIAILVFRFLFNFARWLFPCQELITQTSKGRKVAKYIYFVTIASLIGTLVYNFLSWLFLKLIS